MTLDDDAGHDAPAPLSPEEAKNGAPLALTKCESIETSSGNSAPPQLIEIAEAPLILAGVIDRFKQVGAARVVASTSKIFACGAMACAHSTSSDVSIAQPLLLLMPALMACLVKQPFAVVHAGKLNAVSNAARSA